MEALRDENKCILIVVWERERERERDFLISFEN